MGKTLRQGREQRFVFDLRGVRSPVQGGRFQRGFQRQWQVGLALQVGAVGLAAEPLRVAAAQVLVLRSQGFQLQKQRTLTLHSRAFGSVAVNAFVLRGKKGAHPAQLYPRALFLQRDI
ncbi:hypothetical protein ACFJGX_07265 [Hydrogenophaga sp. UC242_50]|uniref:hypothetical protein n=1 Tax=Hydrogenophaga sp. UC242_50 TaxID=3350169 RepID=UPI0036D27159